MVLEQAAAAQHDQVRFGDGVGHGAKVVGADRIDAEQIARALFIVRIDGQPDCGVDLGQPLREQLAVGLVARVAEPDAAGQENLTDRHGGEPRPRSFAGRALSADRMTDRVTPCRIMFDGVRTGQAISSRSGDRGCVTESATPYPSPCATAL